MANLLTITVSVSILLAFCALGEGCKGKKFKKQVRAHERCLKTGERTRAELISRTSGDRLIVDT